MCGRTAPTLEKESEGMTVTGLFLLLLAPWKGDESVAPLATSATSIMSVLALDRGSPFLNILK